MSLGRATKPIHAWELFCATPKYAQECVVDQRESRTIILTPKTWAQIITINRQVNSRIRDRSDLLHHGQNDVWDLAEDGAGDCEDFQLLKRHKLVAAGLPRRAMRMTVVFDEKSEGHAVLTLVSDRGNLVLDNKTKAVLPWQRTGYSYVKRESQDASNWITVDALQRRQVRSY